MELTELQLKFEQEKEVLLDIVRVKEDEIKALRDFLEEITKCVMKPNVLGKSEELKAFSDFIEENTKCVATPSLEDATKNMPVPVVPIVGGERASKGEIVHTFTSSKRRRRQRASIRSNKNEETSSLQTNDQPGEFEVSSRSQAQEGRVGVRENKNPWTTDKPPETLVLGSSLVRCTKRWINKKTAYIASYPGATISSLRETIDKIPTPNNETKVVVLHVGGNDLTSSSVDEIVGDFWDLYRTVQSKFTAAKIIINGIINRKGFTNSYIDELNSEIEWMCGIVGAQFADPKSRITREHLARDQIHLNEEGAFELADFIKKNSLSMLQKDPGRGY